MTNAGGKASDIFAHSFDLYIDFWDTLKGRFRAGPEKFGALGEPSSGGPRVL